MPTNTLACVTCGGGIDLVIVAEIHESLRAQIYADWNLHGSLSKTQIKARNFNTGTYAKNRQYPSIEVLPPPDTPYRVLTVGWWAVFPAAYIHLFVRPKADSVRSLSTAKTNRRYMLQELERIIHLRQTSIEDVDFVWINNVENVDQYHGLEQEELGSEPVQKKGVFPILHNVIHVNGRRWHHFTSGGIAVNR